MNSAAEHRTCPSCGAAIPANAPQGICPKCLMAAAALGTETGPTGGKRPEPPSLERLAAAFPQLEVIEFIGQGGMGAVYKVRQKQLDRIVALKVLPPGIGGDPSFAERFTREAKALAKLLHPNIVALFEFGQADGIYYLLMEYVDGVSLGQLLRSSRVSPREALAIVPQICDALQYAHDQGIVHRDIKPENILLDRRGRVKVADFGLAKLVEANAPLTPSLSPSDGERVADRPGEGKTPALTDAGKVMGTPAYMAPEQVEHPADVDHRADIYALGVVFYQMLTGELPGKRIEAPSKKVQIDVRLDEVVLRALERKPELRYQQASIFKTQVETIASTPPAAPPVTAPRSWMYCGVDYRSKATLFGLPLLHVVLGIDPATGRTRVAKGIIAIGGIAKGVVAFGGVAMGGLAFGGLAVGALAFGGCALGLLALGGLGVGLVAALGGGVMAPIAVGGGAIGYFACGGGAIGVHVLDSMTQDPVAQQFFRLSPQTLFHQQQLIAAILLLLMLVVMAISIGVPLCLQRRRACRTSGGGGAASVPGSSPQATGGGNQKRSEWIYSVLAFTALLVLAASHNATVMLLGSAISLVIGLFVYRRPAVRAALLVVLVVVGVLAVVLPLLHRRTSASTATTGRLGPVTEAWIADPRVGLPFVFSFETGTFLAPPKDIGEALLRDGSTINASAERWLREHHGDAILAPDDAMRFFDGLVYYPTINGHAASWEELTPDRVIRLLDGVEDEEERKDLVKFITAFRATLRPPAAMVFTTREGSMGVLQILGSRDNPRGMDFRYKLVLAQSMNFSARLAQVIHVNTNTAGFGPVVERMVNLEFGTNCAIDLDSGRLMDGRDDVEEQGADAIGFGDDFLTSSNQTASGLYCINETFAMTVNATNWDNGSADWVKSRADKLPFGVKQSELPLVTVMMMCSEDGELPNTYLFKTREGGRGILQITGFTETPPAVKIRYKLVLAQASPVPITSGRMLLPADRTQPSDEQIRHKIVGTWTVDGDPSRTIENKPDGSFVTHEGTELTIEGTWRVKDGFIVATITNASRPNATLEVESNKVVSIDDYKMVVLSIQGGTNVVTANKR